MGSVQIKHVLLFLHGKDQPYPAHPSEPPSFPSCWGNLYSTRAVFFHTNRCSVETTPKENASPNTTILNSLNQELAIIFPTYPHKLFILFCNPITRLALGPCTLWTLKNLYIRFFNSFTIELYLPEKNVSHVSFNDI